MKEKSHNTGHLTRTRNLADSTAVAPREADHPAFSWWAAPGIDGLTTMSMMVEMNRLFFNYAIACVGAQLRGDSLVRHAIFATRWPTLN